MLLFGEVNADPLTYEVVGDTVTITDCKETASGELVIPSTYEGKSVTSIGNGAFSSCSSLTSVTIPDSVTSIGYQAFCCCSSLTSVTIPDSVTSIGDKAFVGCSSLTSVTIPDSVTSIGVGAFQDCRSLTSVTIPDSITRIREYAFMACSSLTSVTIPDSVTRIGDAAFAGCSSLTSVTIPDSVTSIRDAAFGGCSNLTSVTIPDSVTSIGDRAFGGCSNLTSITISDSVTSIGVNAFMDCSSLTSVTIPDSVTSIGDAAFYRCSSLTSITFEGNVPFSFGANVFSEVSENAKIIIQSGASGFGVKFANLPVLFNSSPPTIVTLTQSLSVMGAQRMELKVRVIGATPFQYQWNKDGRPIPGAVSSVLIIDRIEPSDDGVYSVLVINEYGATVSDEVEVSVIPPKISLEYRINEKGKFELKAIGPSGSRVTFQYSDNFKIWSDYLTLPLNEGSTTFSFSIPSNEEGQSFYRLQLVE